MSALSIVPAVVDLVDAPPDPVSLDATRPADLDCCSVCSGDGAVEFEDRGEWTAEPCWACHGTGVRGAA